LTLNSKSDTAQHTGTAIGGSPKKKLQISHQSTCTSKSALKHLESVAPMGSSNDRGKIINIPVTLISSLSQP
jgi:hypothetical protein